MSAAFFLLLVLLSLVVQGFSEPYRLVTNKIDGPVPNLPESWRGARVVILADFQVGLWLDNRATLRRAVRRTLNLRPAFVLLAGDFIHDTARGIAPLIEILKLLTAARIPCYAVLGNHDYAMPTARAAADTALAAQLEAALASIGIPVLHNEALKLTSACGDALFVVGIGSHVPARDDPQKALEGVPRDAPRITFLHHPESYAKIPAHQAPLAFAGHTHGGQVRLPLNPEWYLLTWLRDGTNYNEAWATRHGNAGNRLYVTRGIGCSVAPIRLNCPPELTLVTLRRPEGARDVPFSSAD